jgi:hypothetical protein
LFDIAEQGEDYALVVRTADRYLPQLKAQGELAERRWVLQRQFAALLASDHFTQALALANSEEPGDTASEHRVLALLGLKQPDEALKALAEWSGRPGADPRAVARLRARTLREAGRFEDMEAELEKLRSLSPSDPRPYVFGVVQRAMGGRDAAAQAAFDDYLFRFSGTTQNLQLLAEPLAEISQILLLERLSAAARERGYPAEPFQILLVQTYAELGNWSAAANTLAALPPLPPNGRNTPLSQTWREWMKRLIEATSSNSDAAGPALVDFLHQRVWPMKIFRKTVEALRRAERLEIARDVVALATGPFPSSAWLDGQRVEIGKALAAREAAKVVPVVATAGLPAEKVYFQRLDDLLLASQWGTAEQLLREARVAKPAPRWVSARDGDLRFAQVQICLGRGEYAELVAAAKLFLNGEPDRCRRVIEVARTVFQKGERDTALALTKETLRSMPDYPPAVRLLTELQPKIPAKPAPKK